MSEPVKDDRKNEGEGNRTADRKYREDLQRHVESGASEDAAEEAEEAEEALQGPEGDELREAEAEGKAGRKTKPRSER